MINFEQLKNKKSPPKKAEESKPSSSENNEKALLGSKEVINEIIEKIQSKFGEKLDKVNLGIKSITGKYSEQNKSHRDELTSIKNKDNRDWDNITNEIKILRGFVMPIVQNKIIQKINKSIQVDPKRAPRNTEEAINGIVDFPFPDITPEQELTYSNYITNVSILSLKARRRLLIQEF